MKSLFDLKSEVVVVTGGLGNLGHIWIEALLESGARVFAIDLPSAKITGKFTSYQSYFKANRLRLFRADVRDRSAMEDALRQCQEKLGNASVLVNNAGIDSPPASDKSEYRLEDIPLEENQRILEVNALGLFQTTQVFGAPMLKEGRGSIINIGSLYASVAPDTRLYAHIRTDPPFLKPPAYGASKAAVINLTKYLVYPAINNVTYALALQ